MNHDQLVAIAAKYLKATHPLVMTEMATSGEEADAIGFKGGFTTLIECKANRRDFLADKKKIYRQHPHMGMGDRRYYMCPEGLIAEKDLPECWGLLYVNNRRGVRRIVEARGFGSKKDHRQEARLLLSTIRRIGQNAPRGISVRVYTTETRNRATVHVDTQDVSNI